MKNPWTTLDIKEVYDNPWINITHRNVLNPNGGKGIYGMVSYKNIAVGIVPLDEEYNTWLVGQYRYTIDEYTWEIPEGGCPKNDDPLFAAKRELQEETGITATDWTLILKTNTSNSVSDEYGEAFVARGLSFGEAEPEDSEDLKVKKLPFEEVYQMVLDGRITDALSQVSIFKTKALIDRGVI